MRTVLVVTRQASFAAAIQVVLDPAQFQVLTQESVGEAEMLLTRGAIDVTVLDAELPHSLTIRLIEMVKAFAPSCPLLIYTDAKQWEWEEEAYLLGVAHVLSKPVRARLLNNLLMRLFTEPEPKTLALVAPVAVQLETPSRHSAPDPLRYLETLRRFTGILTYCLDAPALLKKFLLQLREAVGVNRAIIFLRKPASVLNSNPLTADDRWLRCACAIGLEQSLLQHFALSLGAGIGGYCHRQGRILRLASPEAQSSREVLKEFQLLGAQVAIPILDRESLLGVVLLDERLTGEPYTADELALMFHMLEEVGLALRNCWQHDQLAGNHNTLTDILGQLGSGCLVISNNLSTLHVNPTAVRFLVPGRSDRNTMEFADLSQQLGGIVFTVLKTGVAAPAFKQQMPHAPDRVLNFRVAPFRTQPGAATDSALLLIEDVTEHERAQQLETEGSNLRLIKNMAEHLAHEIGNALVPLSTHEQLLKDRRNDPEFQESLAVAMAKGVKRISRLANQMVFLSRDWQAQSGEDVLLSELIVEAFQEAHTMQPGEKVAQLSFTQGLNSWKIPGDPKALRHAFSEIILNALQASPDNPNVIIEIEESRKGEAVLLHVEVRDSGAGFSLEAAQRAQEPFFSTRNVGLGIGLTVSRKIIESHHGRITIAPTRNGECGKVRVSLPLDCPFPTPELAKS